LSGTNVNTLVCRDVISQGAYAILKLMKRQGGFTIVEVMIVLAVTGLIFLSALALINGRTSQAEFTTAIQNTQSQIQQVINEVGNGFYPNNGTFNCTGGAGTLTINSGGSPGQGANNGCIFLGKIIQFTASSTSSTHFTTYTVAGSQLDATGQEVQSYQSASALALAQASATPPASGLYSLRGSQTPLENGLNVVGVYYCTTTSTANCSVTSNDNPGSSSIGAVGFLSSLASPAGGGGLKSGSQHLNLTPISGSLLTSSPTSAVDAINTALNPPVGSTFASADNFATSPPNTVLLCFASATTKQSGLITLGGVGNGILTASLTIKTTQDCS